MKSNAPWSVKGIERDARETAKEAARREGMTVGEWLNQVIYTAGDPESSNGEIEGLKTSDLVTAIEHLNKKVIGAESKSAAAIDDLSRNIGGLIERTQRLERVKPGSPAGPEFEERLQRIEAKTNDKQRIDTLKALEKAVGQVALQFDTAQKSTITRVESTEKQLQQLASRLDSASVAGEEGAADALGYLKDTIDGLSARIARAERIASEAGKLKADAGENVDAEFVERTGERLRVLGDEIKRGGDQMKTLEASIRKLSEQIDAAERRSSEGVQKVAETISDLRSQFSQTDSADGPDARQEIEAAVAAVTERTETRIGELQRSFEQMISRLESGKDGGATSDLEVDLGEETQLATSLDENAASGDTAATDSFDEFDLDDSGADNDSEATTADSDDEDDAFAFDLDEDAKKTSAEETAPEDVASSILQDVEDAFAGTAPQPADEPANAEVTQTEDKEKDGIDAILAELEGMTSDTDETKADDGVIAKAESAAQTESLEAAESDADEQPTGEAAPAGKQNYLQQARRAAKEAAERAAAEEAAPRRKLTPKQRAILAAKIRRKRLAEQGLDVDKPQAETKSTDASAPTDTEDDADAKPTSLFAKAAGALTALRSKLPGGGKADDDEALNDTPTKHSSDELSGANDAGDPNIAKGARNAMRKAGAKPVTIALGAAILLAAAALFFLVKDLVFGGNRQAAPHVAETTAPAAAQQPERLGVEDAAIIPEAPSGPLTQPRTLYLESVAKLKAASNDGDTRDALKGLEQAAALGHPPAQLQLGELYKLGQGVEQDPSQARTWYERAANGGNVLAMHRAGVMAARGQGGSIDQATAITWFENASDLGLVDSQYNLGAIYHPGGEDSPNPVQDAGKAYYWYSLAARNGDEQAATLAAGLATSLTAKERSDIDARVADWQARTPDPDANEIAPAS